MLARIILSVVSLLLGCSLGVQPSLGQPTVSLTPEVKAEMLRRLEESRSFEIPKMKKKDSYARRICNKGPKGSEPWSQAEECEQYSIEASEGTRTFSSLDELMPAFKGCALGDASYNGCAYLMNALVRSGFPQYALALAEYEPCGQYCRDLISLNPTASGLSLSLGMGANTDILFATTNMDDIRKVF